MRGATRVMAAADSSMRPFNIPPTSGGAALALLIAVSALVLLSARSQASAFALSTPRPPSSAGRSRSSRGRGCAATSTTTSSLASSSPSIDATYDMIVVGGGSAGLTAAKFASTFDKTVCIIEETGRPGGDCTWTGCVPSKTLLAAAKRVRTWRSMNERYGVNGAGGVSDDVDDDASMRRMLRGVKEEVYRARERIYESDDSPDVLREMGIDVVAGRARFVDARTVDVLSGSSNDDANGQEEGGDGGDDAVDIVSRRLRCKHGVVVCTGASPPRDASTLCGIEGLDSVPYWTYENVWTEFFDCILEQRTPVRRRVSETRVVVVGGGPVGCELSQAMSRLGCAVTLVCGSDRLLPAAEAEASDELRGVLEGEGIDVVCGRRVASVARGAVDDGSTIEVSLDSSSGGEGGGDGPTIIVGDHVLLAIGRVPNVRNMGLEQLGVRMNAMTGGIEVNDYLETSVRGVYAAGDCTGDRQFTHYAGYQGGYAARNVLLPLRDRGVLSEVPSTIFTDPEVSSFGLTEREARSRLGDGAVSVAFRPLSEVDRAVCEGRDERGFIKVVYRSKNRRLLGATIMAPAAGEMISELAVARDGGVPFDGLATVVHSYPSYSIALQQMAADVYYDKLKKNRVLYDILKKVGL